MEADIAAGGLLEVVGGDGLRHGDDPRLAFGAEVQLGAAISGTRGGCADCAPNHQGCQLPGERLAFQTDGDAHLSPAPCTVSVTDITASY